MIGRLARYSWTTPALAILLTASAAAQKTKPVSDDLPMSTTGFPMEALWEYAPEAPDGKLTKTGPYYVSRWGGIVLRGRQDGDRVVTALNVVQCGPGKNPRMRVTMLGVPPKNLCDSIHAVKPGTSEGSSAFDLTLLGLSTGWTVIDFMQKVHNNAFVGGLPPINSSEHASWGVTKLGAIFHDENGKRVFFAPGETVKASDRVSFEVKPVMDEDELRSIVTAAALSKWKAP
jgi:hypothetical protein